MDHLGTDMEDILILSGDTAADIGMVDTELDMDGDTALITSLTIAPGIKMAITITTGVLTEAPPE